MVKENVFCHRCRQEKVGHLAFTGNRLNTDYFDFEYMTNREDLCEDCWFKIETEIKQICRKGRDIK